MSSTWTFEPTGRRRGQAARRSLDERMSALSQTPLFAELPKKHLRTVAKASAEQRFEAGHELVREGQTGSVFFVILEGSAKVIRGGRTVKRLEEGDFFGEMSVLTTSPRSATVVAATDTECITLSAGGLREVLRADPAIALRMLTVLAERLEETDRRVL